MRARSSSVAPSGNTASIVRNMGAQGEASPRSRTSSNIALRLETWLTMTSLMIVWVALSSRTSAHVPRRGSTCVWSRGSKPASAPSWGV